MIIKKKSEAMKLLEKIAGGPLSIGKMLYAERMGEEMSQVEFARKLGIPRSNLCDIEKGRRFISPELAGKFAKKLGKSEAQFIRIALQDQINRSGLHYHVEITKAA